MLTYPDPIADPRSFVDWAVERGRSTAYALVLPVTDETLLPISEARGRFEGLARLALPPADALSVFVDKARTMELAKDLGVPFPSSRTCVSIADIELAAADLGLPLVLKPASSVAKGPADVRTSLSVAYATNLDECRQAGGALLAYGAVVAQEFVTGKGVGIEVLCYRGEPALVFQHERLENLFYSFPNITSIYRAYH